MTTLTATDQADTFDITPDGSALVTRDGITYRAARIKRVHVDSGRGMQLAVVVDLIRQTREGRDYRSFQGYWTTLENLQESNPALGAELAAAWQAATSAPATPDQLPMGTPVELDYPTSPCHGQRGKVVGPTADHAYWVLMDGETDPRRWTPMRLRPLTADEYEAPAADQPQPKAFDLAAAVNALATLLEARRIAVAWIQPSAEGPEALVRFATGRHRTLGLGVLRELQAMGTPIRVTDVADCTLAVLWENVNPRCGHAGCAGPGRAHA